jgi:hypothetical protein
VTAERELPPVEFTFNWTRWPFVEVDDDLPSLRMRLDASLQAELEAWALDFLDSFDERSGFSSSDAEDRLNAEYGRLCKRLEESGISFTTSTWWN